MLKVYSRFVNILGTMLILMIFPVWVLAQSGSTSGSVTGTVFDEQGAVIPAVTILAKNLNTGITREVVANESGGFSLLQLPPGNYELTVETEGFGKQSLTFTVELGTTIKVDLKLKVAGVVGEAIEVRAANIQDEAKTESSTSQGTTRIDGLPINRREFLDFALTSPRVTIDRTVGAGITPTSGLSFNGQSGRYNNITIDGLDNNYQSTGAVRSKFSQDAVQEFQVVSDNFSAEFGRALGGVVNIVTKGGTNDFHGRLFFFNRNDNISARDTFSPFKPPFSQYQSGATFSGPIKKDKAFFFTSFEKLSIKQNNFVTVSDQTVASARRLGFVARNGPIPFSEAASRLLVRTDFKINPNDTLRVRYSYDGSYNGRAEPFGELRVETLGGRQTLRSNIVAVDNLYVNTRLNLINETRFQFSYFEQDLDVSGSGPQVQLLAPEGLVELGQNFTTPYDLEEPLYQIVNNVSISRGRYQVKFGGDFINRQTKSSFPGFFNGFSVFQPIPFSVLTGNPQAPSFTGLEAFDPSLRSPQQRAFLGALSQAFPQMIPGFPAGVPFADLPLPVIFIQGFGDPRADLSSKALGLFFQNDIKVTPNLLVKLGVRYDIQRVAKPFPPNNGNFSPRVALSFSPKFLPKLRVNANYGIYFSPLYTGVGLIVTPSSLGQTLFPNIPFPFSVLAFSQPGRSFPQVRESGKLPAGLTLVPQLSDSFQYDPSVTTPYTQQTRLSLDYFFDNSSSISVTYSYVRGLKIAHEALTNPVIRPVPNNPVASLLTGRLDPTKGTLHTLLSNEDSYYHAMSVVFNRKFANNFNFLVNYTLSKSIDNINDIRADVDDVPLNAFDLKAERSLSLQDARHRFVASGTWNINYSKHPLLKDYQLSTIINLESGHPYNLLAGVDVDGSGDAPPSDRPLFNGVPVSRNAGVLPGFATVDTRLSRSIVLKEKYTIHAYVEAFNLFNRVNIPIQSLVNRVFPPDANGNFNLPARTGQNGRFIAPKERFRGALSPRQLQFGFRIEF